MSDIHCIVYLSRAVRFLSEQEINYLLTKARERNAKMEVTGMLLHKERSFMQCIEGSIEGLDHIYSIIKKDQMHTGIIEMLNETILVRQFPDWSMAYQQGPFLAFSRPEDYADHLNLKLDNSNSIGSSARLLLNQFWNT
jgi:hypothetical protein